MRLLWLLTLTVAAFAVAANACGEDCANACDVTAAPHTEEVIDLAVMAPSLVYCQDPFNLVGKWYKVKGDGGLIKVSTCYPETKGDPWIVVVENTCTTKCFIANDNSTDCTVAGTGGSTSTFTGVVDKWYYIFIITLKTDLADQNVKVTIDQTCHDGVIDPATEGCQPGEPNCVGCQCTIPTKPDGDQHCVSSCGDNIIDGKLYNEQCDGGDFCQDDCTCPPDYTADFHGGCFKCGDEVYNKYGEDCEWGEGCSSCVCGAGTNQDNMGSCTACSADLEQWVTGKVGASFDGAAYNWGAYEVSKIFGPPDVTVYGLNGLAWASTRNGNEWVELSFDTPVQIQEVHIHESFCGGAVKRIAARMSGSEEWTTIWSGPRFHYVIRELHVFRPQVLRGVMANQIRIETDQSINVFAWADYYQIDAVKIVGHVAGDATCCGDGVVNGVEKCERLISNTCTEMCSYCGNGIVDTLTAGEDCDGTAHCTECSCDEKYAPNAEGLCECDSGLHLVDSNGVCVCNEAMFFIDVEGVCTCNQALFRTEVEGSCVCNGALFRHEVEGSCVCNAGGHFVEIEGACFCDEANGWYATEDGLACETHCGDTIVAGAEECDSTDGCIDCVCDRSANLSPRNNECVDCSALVASGEAECSVGSEGCLDSCSCDAAHGWTFESADVCITTCGDKIVAGSEECDLSAGCLDDCTCDSAGGYYAGQDGFCHTQCGDEIVAGIEECDTSDHCIDCKCEAAAGWHPSNGVCVSQCGDKIVSGTEECDFTAHCLDNCSCDVAHGYYASEGLCASDCGDDIFAEPEECDGSEHCLLNCTCDVSNGWHADNAGACVSECGDDIVNGAEECDGSDHCLLTCKCDVANGWHADGQGVCVPQCGDDIRTPDEECDGSDHCLECKCDTTTGWHANGQGVCVSQCGDGIVNGAEECDGTEHCLECECDTTTGWHADGQGVCVPQCGDDIRTPDEECDGSDHCLECKCDTTTGWHADGQGVCVSQCGDSIVSGTEECDGTEHCLECKCDTTTGWHADGNGACVSQCGDSIVSGEEECDSTNPGCVDCKCDQEAFFFPAEPVQAECEYIPPPASSSSSVLEESSAEDESSEDSESVFPSSSGKSDNFVSPSARAVAAPLAVLAALLVSALLA